MLASSSGGAVAVVVVAAFVLSVLAIAGLWMTFRKAGRPGWAAIIPIYNAYVTLKVVGRPGWWLILYFIPVVNWIIWLVVLWDLCKSFGKGVGWFFGLWLLPFIFFAMLGFGSSTYLGPAADYEAKDASGRYIKPA